MLKLILKLFKQKTLKPLFSPGDRVMCCGSPATIKGKASRRNIGHEVTKETPVWWVNYDNGDQCPVPETLLITI